MSSERYYFDEEEEALQSPEESKSSGSRKKKHGFLKFLLVLLLILAGTLCFFRFTVSRTVPARAEADASLANTVNILLIGADYDEVGVKEGRSDCIMVLSLNLEDKSIFLLSVPRDTYTAIEGHGKQKINHAFAYGGVPLLRQTVESLLGIPIDYYAATNFAGFENVIDAMGGIDIEVDKDMDYKTYYDHIQLEKGFQHLDGKHALQFVRFRHDALGDIKRVERQQLFMQAVTDRMLSAQGIISLPAVLAAAFAAIDTDMSKSDMLRLGLNCVTWDLGALETATLPGDFDDIDGISYWKPSSKKMQALLQEKIRKAAEE